MATLGLQIGVLVVLAVEICTQVVVVLDEEVGLTDTNPEQAGLLCEELVYLSIAVGIDVGESALTVLLMVDRCREQTYITEEIRIVDADEEAVETTHRQTCDGTVSLVLLNTICLLDKLHYIGECCLEATLHGLRKHHGRHLESLAGLAWTSLLRDVAVGHHYQHRLGLTLSNQVVENLGCTTQFTPSVLVATDTVQQVEYRILLAAGLVAGRSVNGEAAG